MGYGLYALGLMWLFIGIAIGTLNFWFYIPAIFFGALVVYLAKYGD